VTASPRGQSHPKIKLAFVQVKRLSRREASPEARGRFTGDYLAERA
jgi:hypothetical protein